MNDKFERLMDLEFEVRGARASIELQLAGVPLYRKEQMYKAYKSAQARLFSALDELTDAEKEAYGKYRLSAR